MYRYIIPFVSGHVARMKATVDLLMKDYGALCQGGSSMGLIYSTRKPVPENLGTVSALPRGNRVPVYRRLASYCFPLQVEADFFCKIMLLLGR